MLENVHVYFDHFCKIFFKTAGMCCIGPIFSSKEIPLKIRILFVVCITLSIGFNVPKDSSGATLLTMFLECLIGLFIGMIARILFVLFDIAAQIISTFLNLSNAVLFNPTVGDQSNLISVFLNISGIAIFVYLDLHFLIINALFDLQSTSLQNIHINDGIILIFKVLTDSFRIGLHLSAPFFLSGLAVQVLLGIINRIIPQIQIFFISIPFQIFICLTILLGSLFIGLEFVKKELQTLLSNLLL